jgi:hypothetical protein
MWKSVMPTTTASNWHRSASNSPKQSTRKPS